MSLKQKFAEFEKFTPLNKSQKVQEIADKETNFGYDNKHDILQDLYDEINELKEELDVQDDNKNNLKEYLKNLEMLFLFLETWQIDMALIVKKH